MSEPYIETTAARLCVYTVLTGDYEDLNEQPVAARSSIPFLCLTDDPHLHSESWQTKLIPPLFSMDPIRSQRDLKIRPHVHLPEFDASIYIDNSVVLKEPPEIVLERYALTSGFCLPIHSYRDSVLDEFHVVSSLDLDDPNRIYEQLSHYAAHFPESLGERPYWTAILLREHRNPLVQRMLEIWAAHVHRYCRRDQLSVNTAFRQAGLMPDVMEIDNYDSWFHSWPHSTNRDHATISPAPEAAIGPLRGRYREIELQLKDHSRQEEMLHALPAWRVAALLSRWAHRHPRLARMAWRVVRPLF